MGVTWWAIIRFANGNNQRVEVVAANVFNARAMIEAQFGSKATLISGPHRANLVQAR